MTILNDGMVNFELATVLIIRVLSVVLSFLDLLYWQNIGGFCFLGDTILNVTHTRLTILYLS
jgi:hypothetical protein